MSAAIRIVLNVLVSAAAVFATARILRGVSVDGFGTAVVVALVLGAVNGVLRPLLLFLTLPLNVLTLGLFTFVVIGALVELTAALVPGFRVENFGWAMGFAFVLAFVNAVLHALAPV